MADFHEAGIFRGQGRRQPLQNSSNHPLSELLRPIIEGNLRRDGFGSIVTLKMRLVWPIVPFWFSIILFLAWSSVAVDSRLAGPFGARMLLLGMTLFIYLVATIPFAVEVRIAMKRLLELLRPGDH
jgi:hypothetical protein